MRMMIRMMLLPLLLTGMLSACGDHRDTFTPTAQATAVSVGYEVFKARVERRLEMTCNLENIITEGTYCISNYKPTDRQEVFCFKTLGGVDCYAEPDPYSLEGRQLPAQPRALADPRMPMTPPGRRPLPQIATAPYNGYNNNDSGADISGQPVVVAPASVTVVEPAGGQPMDRSPMGPATIAPATPLSQTPMSQLPLYQAPMTMRVVEPAPDPATKPM